ncbi:MAG TPA: four helix bundle protein [Chthoniobacteraceae bacterium]|nr:four helix bundle protein [Chthoniobacteraceae bacterium]
MDKADLKIRTKAFGLRALKLVRHLPRDVAGKVVAHQLTRSALSVGANYRAACRGRSRAEFLSKLGIVLEESDESAYWMEIICDDGMLPPKKVSALLQEANELTAIFFAATTSARKSKPLPKS